MMCLFVTLHFASAFIAERSTRIASPPNLIARPDLHCPRQ
jgi:hypothetical protein